MTRRLDKSKTTKVSVIIPAYKAEKIIKNNLLTVKAVLDTIRYPYEIICVVDGKLDNTEREARNLEKRFPGQIKVLSYLTNLGKGHAVRYGMANATGDIIGFTDAGIDLNANGLSLLLEHFEWYNADIIVGSKRHPASKVFYPWQRRILSFGYQQLVKLLFGLNIKDTQVGMKFFRRQVLEKVLPRVLVKEFAFDIELLSVAHFLGFTRIYEAPIELDMEFGSSSIVSKGFWKTVWKMAWDTSAVFYRLRILHYYDTANKKNWITPKYLVLQDEG
jgi:glycosyltransferase involved in cell wall biosynthesis